MTTILAVYAFLGNPCDSIQLRLTDEEIRMEPNKSLVSCRFEISSCRGAYLLYHFNDYIEAAWLEEHEYCTTNITAGLAVFVYDARMKPMYAVARIPDSINYEPLPHDELLKRRLKANQKFRSSRQALIDGKLLGFTKQIDLANFRLTPGTYYMSLLYYAGENISNLLTEDEIAEDQALTSTKVFKGCIRSNAIRLIVE